MKLLYVTSVYPRWPGDATPPFVQNQAELMAAQAYEVRVLAPHAKGAALSEEEAGVTVRRYRYGWPSSIQQLCYDGGMLIQLKAKRWTALLLPFLLLAQICSVFLECWRWKPDLIHSHSLLPQGFVCALAGVFFKIPHVTTSHGNDVFGLKSNGLMGVLKRFVVRSAGAVTVNSSATRAAVMQLGALENKVYLIPAVANSGEINPEIVNKIETQYGKGPKVLFVGRFIEEKGVLDLLLAFAKVKERVEGVQCLFVGDGVLRAEMERMIRDLNIEQSVHLVGWRAGEEIASWMAAAEALIVPSWREAQGLVVVEAMTVGTPIIASRVGGIPDMVEDDVTGRLFTPGDVAQLVEVIVETLTDHEGRERMRAAASALVTERYAPSAIARQTADLYQHLAGDPPQ